MMDMLRCMFFFRAYWEFELTAEHVPGERNVAADAVSCNNLSLFFQVLPGASPQPTPVSQSLIDLLVVHRPDWTSPNGITLFKNCF